MAEADDRQGLSSAVGAEREYSARAGNQGRRSFGDDETHLGDYAWFKPNSQGKTQPVAKKKPNAFGLYDMHGNVSQFVEDPYRRNYERAASDGAARTHDGEASRRVSRGGSWYDDLPGSLRSTSRNWNSTDDRFNVVGFRVGRALAP
jgi:formylglycine-generating enzyme required for sulfatase activity